MERRKGSWGVGPKGGRKCPLVTRDSGRPGGGRIKSSLLTVTSVVQKNSHKKRKKQRKFKSFGANRKGPEKRDKDSISKRTGSIRFLEGGGPGKKK